MCCVEMGLGMIETMKIFDAERHEGIKMRVGIHTGKRSQSRNEHILEWTLRSQETIWVFD